MGRVKKLTPTAQEKRDRQRKSEMQQRRERFADFIKRERAKQELRKHEDD